MIGAQSALAQLGALHSKHPQAAYQSGFKHGMIDAKNNGCGNCTTYIFEPGNTFYFHTKEFIRGYMQGWCTAAGTHAGGMDENEASFDCKTTIKDPELADWYICGGDPELHGTDFRECPQPTSGYKGTENNSN
jgi:hypothetical protein